MADSADRYHALSVTRTFKGLSRPIPRNTWLRDTSVTYLTELGLALTGVQSIALTALSVGAIHSRDVARLGNAAIKFLLIHG